MDRELTAYCGVDCAACPDLAGGKCPGCRKTEWPEGDACLPVACCREKGISFCGECPAFPCADMKDFYGESGSHERAYALMLSLRDGGPPETAPVEIRRFREEDLGPLYGLLSDPLVMRYLEPPFTEEQTAAFLRRAGLSDPPLIYAAEEDGAFIGYVIFHDCDENGTEIGWVLRPDRWNRGCASLLTEELIRRARSAGREPVIECSPDQTVTEHIARKYGFSYEGMSGGLKVFRLKDRPVDMKRET